MNISKWLFFHAAVLVLAGLMFLLYSPLVIAWLRLGQLVQDSRGYWAMVSFARLFGMGLMAWGGTVVVVLQNMALGDTREQVYRKLLWTLVVSDFLGAFSAAIQAASVWGVPASWFLSIGFGVLGIVSLFFIFAKRDIR